MSSNLIEFRASLNKFSDEVRATIEEATRAATIGITNQVVVATPVDTGRARSNWFFGVGSPSRETTDQVDPAGNASKNRLSRFVPVIDGRSPIFISNNLPYIERLNDGYSDQAGRFFVEMAVQSVERQIDEL